MRLRMSSSWLRGWWVVRRSVFAGSHDSRLQLAHGTPRALHRPTRQSSELRSVRSADRERNAWLGGEHEVGLLPYERGMPEGDIRPISSKCGSFADFRTRWSPSRVSARGGCRRLATSHSSPSLNCSLSRRQFRRRFAMSSWVGVESLRARTPASRRVCMLARRSLIPGVSSRTMNHAEAHGRHI